MTADNVHQLDVVNLRDMATMLEHWADWLRSENSEGERPATLLLVFIPPGDDDPEIFLAGDEMTRASIAGNLLAVANQQVRIPTPELEDED